MTNDESPELHPFLDRMMETSEAAQWLKMDEGKLLMEARGRDARIPGFWIGNRLVRFHPRTIIAKLAQDAGLRDNLIAAMLQPPHPQPPIPIEKSNEPDINKN